VVISIIWNAANWVCSTSISLSARCSTDSSASNFLSKRTNSQLFELLLCSRRLTCG